MANLGDASVTKVSPLAARLDFAMRYARMNRSMLRKAMMRDHGINLTRSTLSKILNGTIKSSRYTMEIAECLGVNPKWLQTGRETMTDVTGRLSTKDRGLSDVKRIARQYLIPPKRTDIVRLHDRLITAAARNQLSYEDVEMLSFMLDKMLNEGGRAS
ncbi:hypothetical protein BTO32_14745 [Marinobacter lutaoensis]|uniref:HTH cro/C1-type domain-containing protein n=1 Tax=Marinobacter lutaoensis TaxID=135739 RepID=A0A1V2DPL6_9GAMM|nr:hypothetical protein [Marinobacter lutaoensis]ONF42469.1 hypothetical protein BTO32_14745 [Marinobacter lutaoensis]